MASTNIVAVVDRVHNVVVNKLAFALCDDPFTFDRVPRQVYKGGVYRIETSLRDDPGRYIGGMRNERHRLECWLLRPNRGKNTNIVYRKLLADLDCLRTQLERDGDNPPCEYYVMDSTVSTTVREASPSDIYTIGHFSCIVDFDRDPDEDIEL